MFDLIIVGSGPAGLTASIYASRYKLNNVVIGKVLGGTITLAHKIENFPGFKAIAGLELAEKMGEQVKALGAEIILDEVTKIEQREGDFKVFVQSGKNLVSKALIVATGTERRKLGVPGEQEYLGRGVSYCTTCDAPFFRGKTVALIGGSNAAVSGAIHAAGFAAKVYIIYRREQLRAEPIWVEEALKNPQIEVIYNTNVTEVLGDQAKVTGVKLDKPYHGKDTLALDGVFVEIGGVPLSSLLQKMGVKVTAAGHIDVDKQMRTNLEGLFVAGDFTDESVVLQQGILACAQGAVAAFAAFKYLKGSPTPNPA
ncbi:hypothetical protein COT66_00890 [Candidatus Shapirobacteria bacterium CG09_land_8_20_14_0_10_49_15]|uniref:FAD/NAD(P)-binding domain-containing protein n=2 Tax=Candidatus Shapironibacteriota TaxID=1752721 RepID=A0A2M6XB41_9BACT|nr:MAG: hypothetical protein COT66_00890 [Candidatus Shapirobacteria bacterium CG09_land_8_20_14_0_10_49_15]